MNRLFVATMALGAMSGIAFAGEPATLDQPTTLVKLTDSQMDQTTAGYINVRVQTQRCSGLAGCFQANQNCLLNGASCTNNSQSNIASGGLLQFCRWCIQTVP